MKIYRKVIACIQYFCLIALIIMMPRQSSGQEFSISDAERLNERLSAIARELHLPAYSIYIKAGHDFAWTSAYGYADISEKVPASSASCYQLASITKPVSACILLSLVEQGMLSLDEPVLPYLKDIYKQYGIELNEKVGEIKIKHLLTHTSDDPAGSIFRYDGDRYSLLTKIISDVSGRSLEDLLMDRICKPAGMKHTLPTSMLERNPEIKGLLAKPYSLGKNLEIEQGQYTNAFNTSTGLISNVEDLGAFLSALTNGSIISEELFKESTSPFILKGGLLSVYGYGWYTEEVLGTKVIWHPAYGYSTSGLLIYIPQYNVSFVLLSNSDLISRAFSAGLPEASILESPFALELIKSIMEVYTVKINYPDIKWNNSSEKIRIQLESIRDHNFQTLAAYTLKGKWNISRLMQDTLSQKKYLALYRALYSKEMRTEPGEMLVDMGMIHSKGSFTRNFSLTEDAFISILSVADGGYCEFFGMYDNVWIEDKEDGKTVWSMKVPYTEYAGGHPRNRIADLIIPLKAGTYSVHFDNSKSPYKHYYDHWEAFPPDYDMWGIKIFKQ